VLCPGASLNHVHGGVHLVEANDDPISAYIRLDDLDVICGTYGTGLIYIEALRDSQVLWRLHGDSQSGVASCTSLHVMRLKGDVHLVALGLGYHDLAFHLVSNTTMRNTADSTHGACVDNKHYWCIEPATQSDQDSFVWYLQFAVAAQSITKITTIVRATYQHMSLLHSSNKNDVLLLTGRCQGDCYFGDAQAEPTMMLFDIDSAFVFRSFRSDALNTEMPFRFSDSDTRVYRTALLPTVLETNHDKQSVLRQFTRKYVMKGSKKRPELAPKDTPVRFTTRGDVPLDLLRVESTIVTLQSRVLQDRSEIAVDIVDSTSDNNPTLQCDTLLLGDPHAFITQARLLWSDVAQLLYVIGVFHGRSLTSWPPAVHVASPTDAATDRFIFAASISVSNCRWHALQLLINDAGVSEAQLTGASLLPSGGAKLSGIKQVQSDLGHWERGFLFDIDPALLLSQPRSPNNATPLLPGAATTTTASYSSTAVLLGAVCITIITGLLGFFAIQYIRRRRPAGAATTGSKSKLQKIKVSSE
jgi:hypothetical protein